MNGTSILAGLIALATFGSSTGVSLDTYYINENSIPMTEAQYEQLEAMGFDEYEIATMSQDNFDKLVSYEFISSETTTTIIGDYVQQINHGDGSVASPDLAVPYPGYGSPPIDTFTDSDATKVMTVTRSYVKSNDIYLFYIKQDIDWLAEPTDRNIDLLAATFDSNLSMDTLSESNIYDLQINIRYKHTRNSFAGYMWEVEDVENVTYKSYTYDGEDHSVYYYNAARDTLAVKMDLPNDTYVNNNVGLWVDYDRNTYTDFKFSMSYHLYTNNTVSTGANIQAYYFHQISSYDFDLGNIVFSTTPPFVSYETSIIDKSFEMETPLFCEVGTKFEV